MIPKRIFYVWGANEPKGNAESICIFTWYQQFKDFEIIEINENSKKYFNFKEELKNNKWFKAVYDRKMWAYVADYIRIKTLYDNGGVYLDTDAMSVQNLTPLLTNKAFVGIQSKERTEPAILGSEKNNPFIGQILEFYKKEIWHSDLYKLPDIFKYYLTKNYGKQIYDYENINSSEIMYNDITLLPKRQLIPFSPQEIKNCNFTGISKDTYTIHWYKGSWARPDIIYFLENKNKLNLEDIDKKCQEIQKNADKEFKYNNIFEKILSIKEMYGKKKRYRVLTIFGLKIKYAIKY